VTDKESGVALDGRLQVQLDSEAREHLQRSRGQANLGLEFLSVEAERKVFEEVARALSRPRLEVGRVEDISVPGPAGGVPVRLYWPPGAFPDSGFAAIVYIHGGGWTVGSIETHDSVTREICVRSDMVVCSVGYRLAPEHTFPAAVEDSCAAVRWLSQNAQDIGIDPDRIGVAGESAGGNIAAAVALAARDDATVKVAGQFLYYPGTCMVLDFATPSRVELGTDCSFYPSRAQIDAVVRHYAPTQADRLNPLASPLLADELTGVAPAVIVTAGFDPLRDEGRMYADRLRGFGVDVTYRCLETTIHGFLNYGKELPVMSEEAFRYFAETARQVLLRDRR